MERRVQKGAFAVAMAAALTTVSGAAPRVEPAGNLGDSSVRQTLGSQRRGRPRKFLGPSRAVTLTLPEDTIATLQAIDPDISRAVVRAIQPLVPAPALPSSSAELAIHGDRAFIVVAASQTLRERTGVDYVPLADGRALICFDERLSVSEFELRIGDALGDPALDGHDRALFETLATILKTARRDDGVIVQNRSIIVLHKKSGDGSVAGCLDLHSPTEA